MSNNQNKTESLLAKDVFVHNIDVFLDPIQNPFQSKLSQAPTPLSGIDREYDIWLSHNSLGYRCDEFTTDHDGKHILFSGCSVTYGIGLTSDEIWSQKLFDKISKEEKLSGYFNLGVPGMGVMEIISGIYKYINQFGKPACIFLNVPDPFRVYLYDNYSQKYFYTQFDFQGDRKIYEKAGSPRFMLSHSYTLIAYQYLMMLESYCKTNNIVLSYINWSNNQELLHESDLKDLYRYTDKELEVYLSEYIDKNPLDKNISTARDGLHIGTGPHYAWSEMLYNVYKEKVGL